MLIKTIDSDEYIIYNNFDEIPKDDLEYIWYLSCNNENITDIDFIMNIPNLKELDASYNLITTIPIHDSLEIINVKNNKIDILPTLLAIDIDISFNKVKLLYGLPNIKKLNISNNLLTSIVLEPSLIELNCSYNNIGAIQQIDPSGHINKIINKIICGKKYYNIEKIDCSYNRLNNINFIFILNSLVKIIYNNNLITYMAPHVKRILNIDGNNNEYYKKSRHSITTREQLKIHSILLKPPTDFNTVKKDITDNQYLTDIAKEQMLYYSNFDEPNYKIYITYKELLCCVWAIIKNNYYNNNYISNLNYIYNAPHICRCRSCQLINLSNFMDINVLKN
jgi:Leucine-rich repeat (LRR) protein